MTIPFGIDVLLADAALQAKLRGRRIALLAHPASMTAQGQHSLDALAQVPHLRVTAALGPQHGLRGDKQDNMVESADFLDPRHGIPVYSLYGRVRRPTDEMLAHCDVILVDLQDLGCRIYTFITTLLYVLEAAARLGKAVWVLDRPNPAGRPVEGLSLRKGEESFVGAGVMPMRHGLTFGEMARWFVREYSLAVELQVVAMPQWDDSAPDHGWPLGQRSWVNPSPNAPSVWMARAYAGTVMLEGTTLSEGRGTTRPLELFGAPDIDAGRVLEETGLLPHLNPGVMTRADLELLRPVSASMGIMLESTSDRLLAKGEAHWASPDKAPARRLETIRLAGELAIPFTSGLLIGIGETRLERIDTLLAIRALHERYGHIQEVIVQNFRAKPGTRMAQHPEPSLTELQWTLAVARLIFGPRMSLQIGRASCRERVLRLV